MVSNNVSVKTKKKSHLEIEMRSDIVSEESVSGVFKQNFPP